MRPKKPATTRSGDLFRARLDQIINLRHELAQLAGRIDWDHGSMARSRRSTATRAGLGSRHASRSGYYCSSTFIGLSDEGVCERWVYDPYFQYFTGEEFFH